MDTRRYFFVLCQGIVANFKEIQRSIHIAPLRSHRCQLAWHEQKLARLVLERFINPDAIQSVTTPKRIYEYLLSGKLRWNFPQTIYTSLIAVHELHRYTMLKLEEIYSRGSKIHSKIILSPTTHHRFNIRKEICLKLRLVYVLQRAIVLLRNIKYTYNVNNM